MVTLFRHHYFIPTHFLVFNIFFHPPLSNNLPTKRLKACSNICVSTALPSERAEPPSRWHWGGSAQLSATTNFNQVCRGAMGGECLHQKSDMLSNKEKHTHIHTQKHIQNQTNTHIHTHIHIHTHTHTHTHTHRETHTRTHVSVHRNTNTEYTHTGTHT